MFSIEYTPPSRPHEIIECLIPGRTAYKINNIGHIWSSLRKDRDGNFGWKPISIWEHNGQYWTTLRNDKGNYCDRPVARYVADAFLGLRPSTHILFFKDGNKLNHGIDNLHYVHKADAVKLGLLYTPIAKGGTERQRKRSIEDVISIRLAVARADPDKRRETVHQLAWQHKMTRSDVMDIVNGRKFVADPGPITPFSINRKSNT